MQEKQPFNVQVELPADVAEGIYSNLALITFSTSEFILDFAKVMPGLEKAKIKSRVVLTPEHAKRLLRTLQDNIARYESTMGKIEIPTPAPSATGPKMGEA